MTEFAEDQQGAGKKKFQESSSYAAYDFRYFVMENLHSYSKTSSRD